MIRPLKPHVIALVCSAGLLAASGALYVTSRAAETPPAPAPAAQPAAPAAVEPAAPTAQSVAATYTAAQIDRWVAPVALYPDNLLSQVLMASTYPSNVLQAVQWSQDNPTMQGDAAVQAVANQPWDPSVKSLVAFPALLSLMGENPQWVQDLGNAFLAQPQDVMNSVQKLRAIAQQTGTLKSSPQQKVTTSKVTPPPTTSAATTTVKTTTVVEPAPTTEIIKIESTDPNVVYVPTYNPNTVYGTWPNTTYPPVYLPPTPGEQFTDSFVNGLGFSLGVATTYALFSSIDWDDDYHHDDDWDHGGYHGGGNNNINIDVDNYNHFNKQRFDGNNAGWQHNPAFRNNVPYPNNNVAQRFHQTNVPGGLSATQRTPANLTNQRQAALDQFQHSTHNGAAKGLTAGGVATAGNRDSQRQAASQQLNKITQRSNYRGYDTPENRAAAKQKQQNSAAQQQRREKAKSHVQNPTAQQQQHRDTAKSQVQQRRTNATPPQRQQRVQNVRSNAFSGNDSRSPSWEAQRQRGTQSRNTAHLNTNQRAAAQQRTGQHRELRHR
ncbi:TPA: DUF3300 domain-containing protein [Raoultella ornithinolytica]|uniref:DUF3300 domain-containing protein n=1 Tax=Raoultella TaxID=160674 RepID=UPI001A28DBAE|nr:DUF3300 domain-containing protein [Raoultella ornithinolytica]EKU8631895.1 DUF3300 domain-containing protein [Raoultella ornithinolytica]MCF6685043.1 DUF3300 domain-containing protein [Raoultella ornithinolytica]HAV2043674.1 DUF3300 domain-containing protein [Raoultella ornithinolytica]HAV2049466.1 DUF3300 domain-containing protein [Raoultella ornithinolytica]HBC7116517.1 DUF3300 domain-containing protein [Raoultella ornithinolytica]